MKPWMIPLAVATLCTSCSETGMVVEIMFPVSPSASTCAYAVSSPQFFKGTFDPTGDDGGASFYLGFIAANNAQTEADSATRDEFDEPIKPRSNDAAVVGYDYCWYITDDVPGLQSYPHAARYGSHESGLAVECADIPTSRFIKGSGLLRAGSDRHLLGVSLLTHDDLRQLFGETFNPEKLALSDYGPYLHDWNHDGTFDPELDWAYSNGKSNPMAYEHVDANNNGVVDLGEWRENPDAPCESLTDSLGTYNGRRERQDARHWGCYPTRRSIEIAVQFRISARLLTGRVVESNWFAFPVQLCVGCVATACGPLKRIQCSDNPRCSSQISGTVDCAYRCRRYRPPNQTSSVDGSYCSPGEPNQCPDPTNTQLGPTGQLVMNGSCPDYPICPDGRPCTPRFLSWKGRVIGSTANSCLPYNGYSTIKCEDYSGCSD